MTHALQPSQPTWVCESPIWDNLTVGDAVRLNFEFAVVYAVVVKVLKKQSAGDKYSLQPGLDPNAIAFCLCEVILEERSDGHKSVMWPHGAVCLWRDTQCKIESI